MARKVSSKDLIKVLKNEGWKEQPNSRKGNGGSSHASFSKDGCIRPVVVVLNQSQLSELVISTNCRTMGITKNQLMEKLGYRLPKKQAEKARSPVNTQTIDKQPPPSTTEKTDEKTVYNDYKAAKATIAEAADSQLAKLKEPLEREQRQLGNKIKTIEKAVAVTESLKPGMFGKASHEEKKQKLSSQLSTAKKDLQEFKRELPKKEAALRAEAKQSAQKRHPAEAEKIKRWGILDKQKRNERKHQGRDPPTRRR